MRYTGQKGLTMSDKQPNQAMPSSDSKKGAPDGVSSAPSGKDAAGESGGNACVAGALGAAASDCGARSPATAGGPAAGARSG